MISIAPGCSEARCLLDIQNLIFALPPVCPPPCMVLITMIPPRVRSEPSRGHG